MRMTIGVSFQSAAFLGILCVAMLAGSASAKLQDPLLGCSSNISDCLHNATNAPDKSSPPANEAIKPPTLNFSVTSGSIPDYESLPLVLTHPEFFGFNSQNTPPPSDPVGIGRVLGATGIIARRDPIPEPASLALLGSALLWFGLMRRRRSRL
jgi:hypothetical protein